MNRFVTGLEKENFKVFEDKKEQEISQFSSEDAPLSIGVVFDCSGSMGRKLEKSRQAVAQFFKTANPEDEFFLVQFNDSADLIQPFTSNLEEIQNRLTFTQSKGRTALLDAIYLALHEMKKAKNPRKALLIISDGGDNSSRYTEAEIKNLVKEADVQIYAIGIYEADRRPRPDARGSGGPGSADRNRRTDRRTPVPRGQPQRIAGHRRQDRRRTAQPIRARLFAAESGTRRQVSQGAGQTGSAARPAATPAVLENGLLCSVPINELSDYSPRQLSLPALAAVGANSRRSQAADPQENTGTIFRSDTRLVVLHTTVSDKNGHLVTDLPQRRVHGLRERRARSRSRASSAKTCRSRMGLIIDNSGSMRDKRAKVEAAALALVKDSNPDDEVFVVNFNDEAFLDNPHGKDFTNDIKEMEEALTRIDSRGGTAMRDAIRMSIDHLKEKAHKDKKVLVVVTDGNDNSSVISLENLVKASQQSEVLIYGIGLLSEEERREAKRAERALNELAVATGGEAFFPKDVSRSGANRA